MDEDTTVLVVGAGRLGRCIAVVFADVESPVNVLVADKNPTLIESLGQGIVSFPEPDLVAMLNRVKIGWSTDTVSQAAKADVALIVVPTPSGADGRFDSSMVCAAVRDVCQGFKAREGTVRPTIVVVSTVMPGACDNEVSAVIRDEGFEIGETIGLAYTPAFVALGSVIEDFKNPDLQMVGCADTETFEAVKALYDRVVNPFSTIKHLSVIDAEIAKLSVNVFLSLKVGFANTVARVCEGLPGANAERVLDAVGNDSRVGGQYLRAGSTAGGVCVPLGTLVQTEYGLREIQDLEIGDMVLSHDGRLHPITEIHTRAYEGDLIQINPSGFAGHPITVTPEHHVWSLKRYINDRDYMYVTTGGQRMNQPNRKEWEPEWIRADGLFQGDYTMLPRPKADYEFEDWVSLPYRPPSRVPLTTKLDEDLCYAFGLFAAEGHTWQKSFGYTLHQKEVDLAEEMIAIMSEKFGIKGKTRNKSSLAMSVQFTCLPLAEYLREQIGTGAPNKRFPHQWLYLPEGHLVALLRGLWYGDGSNSGDVFTIGITSRYLWNFVKMAFLRLGIAFTSRVSKAHVGADGTSHRESYYLRVRNPDFFPAMNRLLPRLAVPEREGGRRSVWFERDSLVSPIRSVSRVPYSGTVWNLEVHDAQSYVLESGTVHNCLPRDVVAFDRVGGDAMSEAVAQADEETINWVLDRVEDALAAVPDDRPSVCVLGLAYKPSVPIADGSLGVEVLTALESSGCYTVTWCDPWDLLPGSLNRVTFEQAKQAVVVVVACFHSEYRGLKARDGQTIVDLWGACSEGEGTVVRPGVGPTLTTSA